MLNTNVQLFRYGASTISFMKGSGKVMVNATQMAKPFGKQPIFWLNNQYTNEYLNVLSKLRKISLADLVQVKKGGSNPGTWMHEDVALEFARWLSPAFAIWCNDRIKEILLNQRACCPLQAPQPVLQVPKVKYRYRTRIVPAAMN